MTAKERTSVARASAVLLGAALLRSLAATGGPAPALLSGEPSTRDSLSAAAESVAVERDLRSRPLEVGEKVDVNRASEVELDRLPGVGPAKAARIVQDRTRNGPFRGPGDLGRVPGFGPVAVERLAPFLSFVPGSGTASLHVAKEALPERRLLGVMERPASATPSQTVRLNRATREQLQSLPGIGPVLAERIVDLRDAHGGFEQVEDLLEVPGVGPATLARLRPLISLQ